MFTSPSILLLVLFSPLSFLVSGLTLAVTLLTPTAGGSIQVSWTRVLPDPLTVSLVLFTNADSSNYVHLEDLGVQVDGSTSVTIPSDTPPGGYVIRAYIPSNPPATDFSTAGQIQCASNDFQVGAVVASSTQAATTTATTTSNSKTSTSTHTQTDAEHQSTSTSSSTSSSQSAGTESTTPGGHLEVNSSTSSTATIGATTSSENQASLTQADPVGATTSSAATSTTSTTTAGAASKSNTAVLIGGIVGGIALVILLAAAVYVLVRRRRAQTWRGSFYRERMIRPSNPAPTQPNFPVTFQDEEPMLEKGPYTYTDQWRNGP